MEPIVVDDDEPLEYPAETGATEDIHDVSVDDSTHEEVGSIPQEGETGDNDSGMTNQPAEPSIFSLPASCALGCTRDKGDIAPLREEEEKKEEEQADERHNSEDSKEKLIIARNRAATSAPDVQVLAFCSDIENKKHMNECSVSLTDSDSEESDKASSSQRDENIAKRAEETGTFAAGALVLNPTLSDDAGSVEVVTVEIEMSKEMVGDQEEVIIDISNDDQNDSVIVESIDLVDGPMIITCGDSRLQEDPEVNVYTGSPNRKSSRRESNVQSIRAKFERGSGENFDANNLSMDIEMFYMNQRAQIAAYQQKRKEALVLYHGAEDVQGSASFEIDQSPMMLARARETFAGNYVGHVFVVHDKYGLLMMKRMNQDETLPKYQVPGGIASESDFVTSEFVTAGRKSGHSKGRLLSASRLAATRELFAETGIDARGSLDRLVPANLRQDAFHKGNDTAIMQNQFKQQIHFFLHLTDDDFLDGGIASAFSNPEKMARGDKAGHFIFEKDPSVVAEMLAETDGFGVADAFILSIRGDHSVYNESVIGLQFKSLIKLLTGDEIVDVRSSAGGGRKLLAHEETVGSIPEAMDVLTYISDAWGRNEKKTPGKISALLKLLAARDIPSLDGDEVIRIQRELDDVRAWKRNYDGLQPDLSPRQQHTRDGTLQQLLTLKAVLREHKELDKSIKKLERSRVEIYERDIPQNDLEIKAVMSDLDSVLSELDSHIDSAKQKKTSKKNCERQRTLKPDAVAKTYRVAGPSYCFQDSLSISSGESSEGRRTIAGGDIYPANRWEVLRRHPACHLKNKIVPDQEEVEVVAVMLKIHYNQRPEAFDSCLCVLNNEKPSALKLSTQSDYAKNRRVQFLLKQESRVGNAADAANPGGSTVVCCWPC